MERAFGKGVERNGRERILSLGKREYGVKGRRGWQLLRRGETVKAEMSERGKRERTVVEKENGIIDN